MKSEKRRLTNAFRRELRSERDWPRKLKEIRTEDLEQVLCMDYYKYPCV